MDPFSEQLLSLLGILGSLIVTLIAFIGVRLHKKMDENDKSNVIIIANVAVLSKTVTLLEAGQQNVAKTMAELNTDLRAGVSALDRRVSTIEERKKWEDETQKLKHLGGGT